ncbi:MAG TPA: TRAP transporter substrate-binding protein [Burkholderiales bacterium]|nr:TRAP transporter substrate-binding protein [Burkholderiales bacterium]
MAPIVIRFGGYQKPASIHNRAAARFGEIVKSKLGAQVSFELIGDVLALGRGSGDLLPMVERGELSCCYISTVRFTRWVAEFKLLELPFIVKDRPAVIAALNGELGAYLKRRVLEATPYRVLGFWDNGFRHFSNRVRPIRTPADCRGLRIRTQMSELHGEAFRALGFEPIPADIKEFVAEIAGDKFDAQDNPLTNIYNFGVHKVHRYVTLSGHFFGASAFAFNNSVYESWPADVRTAVDAAALEATAYQHALAAAEDAAMLAKLSACDNEVISLTAAEQAAFAAALAPVLEKYRRELGPDIFARLER